MPYHSKVCRKSFFFRIYNIEKCQVHYQHPSGKNIGHERKKIQPPSDIFSLIHTLSKCRL